MGQEDILRSWQDRNHSHWSMHASFLPNQPIWQNLYHSLVGTPGTATTISQHHAQNPWHTLQSHHGSWSEVLAVKPCARVISLPMTVTVSYDFCWCRCLYTDENAQFRGLCPLKEGTSFTIGNPNCLSQFDYLRKSIVFLESLNSGESRGLSLGVVPELFPCDSPLGKSANSIAYDVSSGRFATLNNRR
jgi:hypothetical protein